MLEALVRRAQDAGAVRTDISAIDVMMMIKGVCETAGSFQHLEPDVMLRQLDLVRAAISARRGRTAHAAWRAAVARGSRAGQDGEQGRHRAPAGRDGLTAALGAATGWLRRSAVPGRRVPPARPAHRARRTPPASSRTPARTPDRKSRLDPLAHASRRRSASKRSRSSSEPARALPQMRILQPGLIAEQQVVHLPEAALAPRRLGGAGRRPGARVAGAHGEVTEDAPQSQLGAGAASSAAQYGHSKSA